MIAGVTDGLPAPAAMPEGLCPLPALRCPRAGGLVERLPRTETGTIQRDGPRRARVAAA